MPVAHGASPCSQPHPAPPQRKDPWVCHPNSLSPCLSFIHLPLSLSPSPPSNLYHLLSLHLPLASFTYILPPASLASFLWLRACPSRPVPERRLGFAPTWPPPGPGRCAAPTGVCPQGPGPSPSPLRLGTGDGGFGTITPGHQARRAPSPWQEGAQSVPSGEHRMGWEQRRKAGWGLEPGSQVPGTQPPRGSPAQALPESESPRAPDQPERGPPPAHCSLTSSVLGFGWALPGVSRGALCLRGCGEAPGPL